MRCNILQTCRPLSAWQSVSAQAEDLRRKAASKRTLVLASAAAAAATAAAATAAINGCRGGCNGCCGLWLQRLETATGLLWLPRLLRPLRLVAMLRLLRLLRLAAAAAVAAAANVGGWRLQKLVCGWRLRDSTHSTIKMRAPAAGGCKYFLQRLQIWEAAQRLL